MSNRYLCHVSKGGQSEWLHVSQVKKTAMVRHYAKGYSEKRFDLPQDQKKLDALLSGGERYSLSRIATMTEDVLDFSADKVPHQDKERWQQIIHRLIEVTPSPESAASTIPASRRRQQGAWIPQTRLRRFYQTLRILNATEVHKAVAEYLTGEKTVVERIQEVFKESVEHFSRYSNPREPFHSRLRPDWRENYRDKPRDFAHCLVARLRPEWGVFQGIEGSGSYAIRAVDYEISPYRTTGHAMFEDGKAGKACGGGGVDLLLQDKQSNLPIIGEIKAPDDTNLFLALMQTLTYAVELTSANQAQRLKKFYKQFADLPCDDSGCQCDIFLFHSVDDATPKLLDQTKKLASRLLESSDSPVAQKIRRIAIVKTELSRNGEIKLCMTSLHGEPKE